MSDPTETEAAARSRGPAPLWAALAVVLLLVLYLGRIGGFPFQDPDEGRYAEIPREMMESGDWLTPRLNYVKYYEKPPLFYWLVGASFLLFGTHEWAARLVPALAGLLTIGLTFALGRSVLGPRAAWIGAAMLATSPLFFGLAQAVAIDMVLTACTTATLATFWFAHRSARKGAWVLLVALAAALGVLAKGLVALVLPGMIALAALLVWRDLATLRALVGWRPVVLFLAVAAPWFVLVSRAHPEFAYFIFVREHFERFAAEVGHPEGPFYYLPVLLLGPLPWSIWAILLAFSREARAAFATIPAEARWFLSLWAGLVLLFFTAASSKLAPYILPALPALALLLGGWVDRLLVRSAAPLATAVRVNAASYLGLGLLALVVGGLGWPLSSAIAGRFHFPEDYVAIIAKAVFAVGCVLLATVVLLRRQGPDAERRGTGFAVLAGGMAFALLAAVEGRSVVKTSRSLAEAFSATRQEGDRLVSYRHLMQSLIFYAGSRVVQVDAENEIEHGADYARREDAAAADEWFWTGTDRLLREWSSARRIFLATSRRKLADLDGKLDPAPRLLAQDHERLLLVNFDAPGSRPMPAAIAPPQAGG